MKRAGFRSSLRYRFDTFMAKGGISVFISLLMIFIGILVFLAVLRGLLLWLVPEADIHWDKQGFWGNVYIIFLQLTDPGNMCQDIRSSTWYKFVAVLAGIAGVIMLSALIAFITTALNQKLNDLRRGRSKVIEEGHTLILGWDEQRVAEILRELVIANESESDACVVILSNEEKVYMDDVVRLRIPDLRTTRIVTRTGDVTSMMNLDTVSVQTCKSVIILAECDDTAEEGAKASSDARVIQTILAVTSTRRGHGDVSVVVEIFNPVYREVVRSTFPENVVTVNTEDILAKIMVQTSRSVGLSVVYNEILSFDGCEMYFHRDNWGGVTFGELAFRFQDGVPMGLRSADGHIVLNPPADRQLEEGDHILILAEDDSTIRYRKSAVARPRDLDLAGGRNERRTEKELILGWTAKAPLVLKEYADYVRPGSRVDIMLNSPTNEQRDEIERVNASLADIEVGIIEADRLNAGDLLSVEPFSYDNIIILAEGDLGTSSRHVDSGNIVTLLLLREIFREHSDSSFETKLITEILDSQNYDLVYQTGVKDVIISNRLVSMILAQISEARDVQRVYDDIFQEAGSEIYLKPASLYFDPLPTEVTFAEMMLVARKRKEVCLGVKVKSMEDDGENNFGVMLIPPKNDKFKLVEGDTLVVLAEDES